MTWGDIVMMSFLELKQTPQYGKVDLLSTFPKLLAQYTSVRKHPGVERWLNIRPKTTKWISGIKNEPFFELIDWFS